MVKRFGLTTLAMKVSIKKVKNTEEVNFFGLMDLLTTVTLLITIFKAVVFIPGLMVADLRENGKTTKCMEEEFLLGLMEDATKGNISMIKSRVQVSLLGQTVENMMANGTMANNMVSVHITLVRTKLRRVNGKMGNAFSGLKMID